MANAKLTVDPIRPGSNAGIGLRILQVRKELGLSQAALAEAIARKTQLRTNKGQVSQWETSRAAGPQDATLVAIASVLGVSAKWLASGQGARVEAIAAGSLRRAVQVACAAVDLTTVSPQTLACVILEVGELLAEDPTASDRVLARVARLACRSSSSA